MRRIGLTLIAALALMSVVLVSTAGAHRFKADSDLTVKYEKPNKNDPYAKASFTGSVNSKKARCERRRTIVLKLRTTTGTTDVGSAFTDRSGNWSLAPDSVVPGTYFAQTPKRVIRKSSRHKHVCRAGLSRDVKVK